MGPNSAWWSGEMAFWGDRSLSARYRDWRWGFRGAGPVPVCSHDRRRDVIPDDHISDVVDLVWAMREAEAA